MTGIRKTRAVIPAALALLFPAASHAYTIDDLVGDWFCASRQNNGELSGEHSYTIRPDRSAVITGKVRQNSDDIRAYIEYQVEHNIIITGTEMSQIPTQVDIQTLLINDEPAPEKSKQDLQNSMMYADVKPFPVHHVSKDEFFYRDAAIVTACGKET